MEWHKNSTRRAVLKMTVAGGVTLASGLAMPSMLAAQDTYPSRPINVIVPFATGGYNDRLARAFAPYLEKELGQPLIIVNQEGAGAQLGHTYALQQPNDGYTVLLHLGLALHPAVDPPAERALQGWRISR